MIREKVINQAQLLEEGVAKYLMVCMTPLPIQVVRWTRWTARSRKLGWVEKVTKRGSEGRSEEVEEVHKGGIESRHEGPS